MNSFLKALFGLNNQNDQEIGDFKDNNVSWQPATAKPGENLKINYQGLLKNLGAEDVFLHYGFDSWSNGIQTIKMERRDDGNFGAEIMAGGNHEINFCFKDSANNWDNNDGSNWTLNLQSPH